MEIPTKVKICGHEYSVRFDKNLFATNDTGGKACANMLEITLADGDFPESRRAEVFLHEIIEMIKYTLQADLDHKDLSAISEVLFAVIRDNDLDFRVG